MTQAAQAAPPVRDYAHLDKTLAQAKGRLFFKKRAAWLGSLMCSHDFIWVEDAPTAWCDGETIGINPDFWLKLGPEERITLLAHELWHTGYDHMHRMGTRDPEIWNHAGDYVINGILDDDGFSFKDMHPLLDHQYDNMTTEQIYDKLEQEAKKQPCSGQGQGHGQGNPHDLSGDIRVPEGGSSSQNHEKVIAKIVAAKQSAEAAKEAGTMPGEIQEIIDNFLNPVLPWHQLLRRFFSEVSRDDYSWRQPSRRHEDIYLPSLMADNGLEHLTFYMDISGSMTREQLIRVNSEVKSIHDDLGPKRLTVVSFDTMIHDVIEFTDDQPFEKLTFTGRGGTSLSPVYKHIKENKPTAAVIFSDLYCSPMNKDPGVPVIWIIVDHAGAQTQFGRNVHLKADQI